MMMMNMSLGQLGRATAISPRGLEGDGMSSVRKLFLFCVPALGLYLTHLESIPELTQPGLIIDPVLLSKYDDYDDDDGSIMRSRLTI
jgi:hypothetical protein